MNEGPEKNRFDSLEDSLRWHKNHWQERAEKAEARIATLEAELAAITEDSGRLQDQLDDLYSSQELTEMAKAGERAEADNVALRAALTEAKAVLIGMHDPQMEVERNSCLHLIGLTLDGHSVAGDVVAAARPLYEAFLSRHGCFPIDRATEPEKLWNSAMSKMGLALDKLGREGG